MVEFTSTLTGTYLIIIIIAGEVVTFTELPRIPLARVAGVDGGTLTNATHTLSMTLAYITRVCPEINIPVHNIYQYVIKPEDFEIPRSIPLLLMPWHLASPGHQQPWYWISSINRSLSSTTKDFNYLIHPSIDCWDTIKNENIFSCLLTHCGQVTPYSDRDLVNIHLGNDLLPGNKQLPEPMLTQIYVAIWHG